MPFNGDSIRQFADFLGQFLQKLFAEIGGVAVGGFKERRSLTFEQFDPQTFACYGKDDVLFDLLKGGRILDRLLEFCP